MWPNSDTLNFVFDKVTGVYNGSLNKLDEGKNYFVENTVNNTKKIWDAANNQCHQVKDYIGDHLPSNGGGGGGGNGGVSDAATATAADHYAMDSAKVVVDTIGSQSRVVAGDGVTDSAGAKLYDLGGKLVRRTRGLFFYSKNGGLDESGISLIGGGGGGGDSPVRGGTHYYSFSTTFSSRDFVLLAGGIATSCFFVYGFQRYCYSKLNKTVHYLSYKDFNNQIVLVLGSMVDPITRAQVHDLYRRGYIIYVCSATTDVQDSVDNDMGGDGDFDDKTARDVEEEWVKASEEFNNNDSEMIRLNYITSKPQDLAKFIKSIQIRNWNLKAIILSHNNVSQNINFQLFENGINDNLMDLIKVLYKILPFFQNLKVILLNPSLSLISEQSYNHNSSLEILSSNIITGLFQTLGKIESKKYNHKIYMVQLGLLSFGNKKSGYSLANYKYLQIHQNNDDDDGAYATTSKSLYEMKGSKIQESFLNPVANLIMDKYAVLRWCSNCGAGNNIMYCGKGSTLFIKHDFMKKYYLFKMWIFSQNLASYMVLSGYENFKKVTAMMGIKWIQLKSYCQTHFNKQA